MYSFENETPAPSGGSSKQRRRRFPQRKLMRLIIPAGDTLSRAEAAFACKFQRRIDLVTVGARLLELGMSTAQVSKALGIPKPTFLRWWRLYWHGGVQGLRPQHPPGRPRKGPPITAKPAPARILVEVTVKPNGTARRLSAG